MIQMELVGPRQFEMSETDLLQPAGNQILVKVKAASICGADMTIFEGKTDLKFPLVIGHDFSGVVHEVGEKVDRLQPGNRIVVDPQRSCGKCHFCNQGLIRYCEHYAYMGKAFDGAFQEFVLVEDRYCVLIPDNISHEEAALIEPFAVGLHAFEFLPCFIGDTVVISGCGPIGIALIQLAKSLGLNVIALEVIEGRREAAKKFGADIVFDPIADKVKVKEQIRKEINGRNFFIEAAGNPQSLQGCIQYISRGGVLAMVGSCDLQVNLREFLLKGLTFYGVRGGGGMYPRSVSLVSNGRFDLNSMISKHFQLVEIEDAIRFNITHKSEVIKVIINYDN